MLDVFQYALLSSYLLLFCLSYFILAVPMSDCLGKHLCVSYAFPLAILNGIYLFFFLTVQLQVQKRIKCEMVEILTRQ